MKKRCLLGAVSSVERLLICLICDLSEGAGGVLYSWGGMLPFEGGFGIALSDPIKKVETSWATASLVDSISWRTFTTKAILTHSALRLLTFAFVSLSRFYPMPPLEKRSFHVWSSFAHVAPSTTSPVLSEAKMFMTRGEVYGNDNRSSTIGMANKRPANARLNGMEENVHQSRTISWGLVAISPTRAIGKD